MRGCAPSIANGAWADRAYYPGVLAPLGAGALPTFAGWRTSHSVSVPTGRLLGCLTSHPSSLLDM